MFQDGSLPVFRKERNRVGECIYTLHFPSVRSGSSVRLGGAKCQHLIGRTAWAGVRQPDLGQVHVCLHLCLARD